MILMNLTINNVLAFNDFDINFSYPMKLRKTTIDGEFLSDIPSFRYKKVNIFVGANASGKTSLMKVIWRCLLFLKNKDRKYIDEIINKKYDNSYIALDLVSENDKNEKYLVRIKIKTDNKKNEILTSISQVKLTNGDSYESKKKDLDSICDNYANYIDTLNKNTFNIEWHTLLPATEFRFDIVLFHQLNSEEEREEYLFVLNSILKSLDPSIIRVTGSADSSDAYVVEHENIGKIIVQNGYKISDIPFLSSGTKYGINIANIIYSIKKHNVGIYIIDEQFSYVNSDVEVALINTIVSLLSEDEQIFITTHNSNVLDIKFPFHTFNFMKKEKIEGKTVIRNYCASLVENRNNVSARSIIDNDMLATAPDLTKIFELGE